MRTPLLVLVLLTLATSTLAGCAMPQAAAPCSAQHLIDGGVTALARYADPQGGVASGPTTEADPRTTAWTLLAAGLARRTGTEGAFDANPHVAYLSERLDDMVRQDGPVDSVANNISLARAALQAWGRPANGIPIDDPDHPNATSLAAAWEARYDPTTGRYGTRFNEHLFAAFAAWLFEPPSPRLVAMADHTRDLLADPGSGGDPTQRDAWWAAYARAALGPAPGDPTAERLDQLLDERQDATGGVRGFDTAKHPDASTTAAALIAWHRAGEDHDGQHTSRATEWLCTLQRDDGSVPFSAEQPILFTKTTAEVVIALALIEQPIPWYTEERA